MSRLSIALRAVLAAVVFSTALGGLAIVSTVPANAHQGAIKVVKTECVDGNTMKTTYQWSWNSVPSNSYGTNVVKKTGTTSFEGNWGGSGGSPLVTVNSASGSIEWTVTLNKSQFSGSNGPWEYVYAPWSDGYTGNRYNDTRVEGFDWSKCLTRDATADVKVYPPTCTADGYAEIVDLKSASPVGKLNQAVGVHDQAFNADAGHAFSDGNTTKVVSYAITAKLTGGQCITKVPLPVKQLSFDTCNAKGVTDNVAWKSELPVSDAQVNWTESTDGKTRTAMLVDTTYMAWEDGTTAAKVFTLDKDSGELCITKVPLPAKQPSLDTCNAKGVTDNVGWAEPLPVSTDKVIWIESADGHIRTASLKDKTYTEWTDGTTDPKVFTLDKDSGEVCVVEVVLVAPRTDKVCGPDSNDRITPSSQPEGISGPVDSGWVKGARTLTYSPKPGYVISEGKGYSLDKDGNAVFTFKDSHESCGLADTGGLWTTGVLIGLALICSGLVLVAVALRRRGRRFAS